MESTVRERKTVEILKRANDRRKSLAKAHLSGQWLSKAKLGYAHLEEANFHATYLEDAYMQGAHLEKADLSIAKMSRVDLARACLDGADLSGARLYHAKMHRVTAREANFKGAALGSADLSSATLVHATFENADLTQADLRGAVLKEADLTGATLMDTHLHGANLSGAVGLLDPIDWLEENFVRDAEGAWIVFKTFGAFFIWPNRWEIEPRSILTEVVNPDRTLECGCGINVATLDWIDSEPDCDGREIWQCRIRPEWESGIVVPYNTQGKFRCSRLELVRVIDPHDLDDE